MSSSKVCKVLDDIDKDENYIKLKLNLLDEFVSNDESVSGTAYYHILNGVLDVLSKYEELDNDTKLNNECLILIEDIATTGKCRYPWKVVKMLMMVVYNKLFDELYQTNKAQKLEMANKALKLDYNSLSPSFSDLGKLGFPDKLKDSKDLLDKPKDFKEIDRSKYNKEVLRNKCLFENEEEYRQLKMETLLYIMDFDLPPFTLQRLCEIPLNQPYRTHKKLFNAYRKLFSVRNIEYEPEQLPNFFNLLEFSQLNQVYLNLNNWEKKYHNDSKQEWDEELFGENSEELESSDEKNFKRPLE